MNFQSKDYYFKEGEKTVIIAEIGVNHNGDLGIAKRMVDMAKKAGADIAKFSAFKSEKEISKFAAKAPYQEKNTSREEGENQLEMCKKLELSESEFKEIKDYCAKIKMPFLCSAFELDSLDFLVDTLKVKTIKIPSPEITNIPFLKQIGAKKVGAILSTGASTLIEVGIAIETLLKSGCPELVLFHCVSNYPAPYDQINLCAMQTLKKVFNLPVGFSDHTIGIEVPIIAATLGAVAVEKHFTLDRKMKGPDHQASAEPDELKKIIEGVKIVHLSLGSSVKKPSLCEMDNLNLIRKSLVAAHDLKKGTSLTEKDIEIKRPEGGIKPEDFDKIIGFRINRNIEYDELLTWKDLK